MSSSRVAGWPNRIQRSFAGHVHESRFLPYQLRRGFDLSRCVYPRDTSFDKFSNYIVESFRCVEEAGPIRST